MTTHNYNLRDNTETRATRDTIETIVLSDDSDDNNDPEYNPNSPNSPNRSRQRVKPNNGLILINNNDQNNDQNNDFDDNGDYSDDEGEEATENLIINKARSSVEAPNGTKNANGNITELISIYAGQQQLDNKEKDKLHRKISELEKELDRLEIQQRYKDLETNNILIERDELKEKREDNEKKVKKTMEDFERWNKKIKERESLLEVKDGLYKFLIVMSGICNAYLYLKSFTYENCDDSKSSRYF